MDTVTQSHCDLDHGKVPVVGKSHFRFLIKIYRKKNALFNDPGLRSHKSIILAINRT